MKVMVSFNDTVDGDLYVQIKDHFYKRYPEIEIYGRNLTNHFKSGTQELHDNAKKLNERLIDPDLILVLLSQVYLNNDWLSNELSALLNLERYRNAQGKLVVITLTSDIKFERYQTWLRSRINYDIDFSKDRNAAIAALEAHVSTAAIQNIPLTRGVADTVNGSIDSREVSQSTLPNSATFNLHGAHSRINFHSRDNSTNSSQAREKVFADLRQAIQTYVKNEDARTPILSSVTELEAATDTDNFIQKYQNFITSAVNHLNVLSPFILELSRMLSD
jgi:hypothetical protein